jgi:hypothetical protein
MRQVQVRLDIAAAVPFGAVVVRSRRRRRRRCTVRVVARRSADDAISIL